MDMEEGIQLQMKNGLIVEEISLHLRQTAL
jgi:hypothetical protein